MAEQNRDKPARENRSPENELVVKVTVVVLAGEVRVTAHSGEGVLWPTDQILIQRYGRRASTTTVAAATSALERALTLLGPALVGLEEDDFL